MTKHDRRCRSGQSATRRGPTTRGCIVALFVAHAIASAAHAAMPRDSTARCTWSVRTGALVTLGSPTDERRRLAQSVAGDTSAGTLLRAASVVTPALDARIDPCPGAIVLLPEIAATWNSRLPFGANDAALWAGRGTNVAVRAGVALHVPHVAVVLAPELTHSENLGYQIMTGREPGRSPFSSPWHIGSRSADLPSRFGDAPLTIVGPGQSSVTFAFGAVALGGATENLWWGPGYRNALVMSNEAEGVPHLFVRTAHPVATRLGDVEARLMVGGLTESLYFDTLPGNDYRSLSGVAVTLRPAWDRALTLGIARTVVGPMRSRGQLLGRAADALVRWETLGDSATGDTTRTRDQLASVFARWAPPGFEVYGEWSRVELPRSLRDLLLAPQHTQGYTVGLTRAQPLRDGTLRVQAEASNLEQSRVYADRPTPPDYYTGRAAVQGYTQRGQLLGAAVGPGGSGQYVAADYFAPAWRAGLQLGRERYENDALYRQFLANLFRHDVGLFAGARGGLRLRHVDALTEVTLSRRRNYLFQNGAADVGVRRTVDVHNLNVAIRLAPR